METAPLSNQDELTKARYQLRFGHLPDAKKKAKIHDNCCFFDERCRAKLRARIKSHEEQILDRVIAEIPPHLFIN
jgi:hypothetical protein